MPTSSVTHGGWQGLKPRSGDAERGCIAPNVQTQPSPAPATVPADRLAAVAAAVSDAIVTADRHGTITGWLGGAEAIFGWTAAEAVGRPLTDLLVPPTLRSSHDERYTQVADGAPSHLLGAGPVEVPALRRDGTTIPVELTLGRGEDASGPFMVGVLRDVSARHQAEARLRIERQRFTGAFAHAPIGMTMTAPTGRLLRVNDAFAALLGRPEEELLGLAVADITHPDDRHKDAEHRSAVLDGRTGNARFEKRYLRADGSAVWCEATLGLVRDENGEPLHFLTQTRDVGAERAAKRALERSNRELEELAAVASHDLQAPLAVVGGFLELLRTRQAGRLDAEGRAFIGHAEAAVRGMRDRLGDMLRLARHEAHAELHVEPVDLREVTVQALASVSGDAQVKIERLPVVRGDAALLTQVLQNLIGNALRHADPASPRVRISATETPDGWCVSVADNGAGVPEADRERIFERFSRGPRHGAAGMGLAICRRAIERLGGSIWMDEAPGGGADVRFTLPR